MFKEALNPFEHQRMEEIIEENRRDLQEYATEIRNLRKEIIQVKQDAHIKTSRAYSEKDRVVKVLENLQKDYDKLTDDKQRKELLHDTMRNYRGLEDYLDRSEVQKDIQSKIVSSLIGMYEINKAKDWGKEARKKGRISILLLLFSDKIFINFYSPRNPDR